MVGAKTTILAVLHLRGSLYVRAEQEQTAVDAIASQTLILTARNSLLPFGNRLLL